jgi:chromosome segregation ATPase
MIATSVHLIYVAESALVFVPFVLWLLLVSDVMRDIVRSNDLSNFSKTVWILAQFVLPLVGSLLYVLTRGRAMHERMEQPEKAVIETTEALQVLQGQQSTLEAHLGEALELAQTLLGAQTEQSVELTLTTQEVKSARAAQGVQSTELFELSQSLQTVKSILNEQADQLAQLAQSAQVTRAALTTHSHQLTQLPDVVRETEALHTAHEELAQRLEQMDETLNAAQSMQAQKNDELTTLAQRNPLGHVATDDIEEYIRRIARTKE